MTKVLVINSGSSSLKMQIVDTARADADSALVTVLVERIGLDDGLLHIERAAGDEAAAAERTVERDFADHTSAVRAVLELCEELGVDPATMGVEAVGHRVVHGGTEFSSAVRINDEVKEVIDELSLLAPLHNPPNLRGIRVAEDLLPDLPHVAVFDTGFFQSLPARAYTYAIDRERADEWDLRRYGFHGTSHDYVSHRAAEMLGRPYDSVNQIVLHLGNGASMSAIERGRAVDTSMGLTPLEGLVMGTRPGDIDPGLLIHLMRDRGVSAGDLSGLLNKDSGLKGLSGHADFREVTRLAAAGDRDAALAYDVVLHRLRRYLGGYWALLGELDAITFTAGVGENSTQLRADTLSTLSSWGVTVDEAANAGPNDGPRVISGADSQVTVMVIPTNEELSIARACVEVLGR